MSKVDDKKKREANESERKTGKPIKGKTANAAKEPWMDKKKCVEGGNNRLMRRSIGQRRKWTDGCMNE